MSQVAKIAVEAAPYAVDKPFSYLVGDTAAKVGSRVLVPFGRGNRTSEGVVLSITDETTEGQLKTIRTVLDEEPLLGEKEIRLALWMHQRYFCTVYEAVRTILPAAVWYQHKELWQRCGDGLPDAGDEPLLERLSGDAVALDALIADFGPGVTDGLHRLEKQGLARRDVQSQRKISDRQQTMAALRVNGEEAMEQARRKGKSGQKMADAIAFLSRNGATLVHDLCYFAGVSRQTVNSLVKHELVTLWQEETYRIRPHGSGGEAAPIVLNDEQQQVYDHVLSQTGKAGVTLLQGVTGSGKTLVYIRLAQALLAQGKSVMILVPEIALTPQMMDRFSAYFGDEVALLHSALPMTERYDQWKRIRRGEAHIVLGTRSAVFAPLSHIGLIVLDEEQESSYESENAPSYHARDVAKFRCAQEGARLLLGSATPTVETAWLARHGEYRWEQLRRRYNDQRLPRVIIADMRQELKRGNVGCISEELRRELAENLSRGEQSILFLNRRGASREVVCPGCGYVPQCPRCSVYLTYHSANGRMMCHYCGHSEPAEAICPDCGSAMKQVGVGTQKAAEELAQLFPGVEVLRMDADTVGSGHEAILRRFDEEKIPILLGTQMVAKGLDFENVTLVGVLAADMGLYVDHYRAAERTFSLLTQVVGRAGRGEKAGRAVIQTFTPENEVILSAAEQNYDRFYEGECRLRQMRHEPPFADLFRLTVTGMDEGQVLRAAVRLRDSLCREVEKPLYAGVRVIGPAPYPVVRVNMRYRYRITVAGKNDKTLRSLIAAYLVAFSQQKENRELHLFADCNLMD